MKNLEKNNSLSFKLWAILSSMMKARIIPFSPMGDANLPFAQHLHSGDVHIHQSPSSHQIHCVQLTLILLNNDSKVQYADNSDNAKAIGLPVREKVKFST